MKILKLYGSSGANGTFSYQGVKSLYDDSAMPINDTQTAMAVIQWIRSLAPEPDPSGYAAWLWDNEYEMQWDDGAPIILD